MYDKMNPEFKAKWLAALRGGEYQQAQGALRRVEEGKVGYCCLGVACEISGKGRWRTDGHDRSVYGYQLNEEFLPEELDGRYSTARLPITLRHSLGISWEAEDHVIQMNDGNYGETAPKTFTEIAQWIEENL